MKGSARAAKDSSGLALCVALVLAGVKLCSPGVVRSDNRVALIPHLRAGDTMRYESHARLERHVKSESRVVTLLGPRELKRDLSAAFTVSIKDIQGTGDRPTVVALAEVDAPADAAA